MTTGEHILGRKMLLKEEPKRKQKKKSIFYGQEAIRNSSCLEFTVESDGG